MTDADFCLLKLEEIQQFINEQIKHEFQSARHAFVRTHKCQNANIPQLSHYSVIQSFI